MGETTAVVAMWTNPIVPRAFDFLAVPSRETAEVVSQELADLPSGAKVLDVGVGTGIVAKRLSMRRDLRITGIDISPNSLALAGARVPRAELIEGSVLDIPAPANSFDAVLGLFLLRYVDVQNTKQAVAELTRVAKPGAPILLGDLRLPALRPRFLPAQRSLDNKLLGVWSDTHGLIEQMEQRGYRIKITHYPFLSFVQVWR